MAYTHIDIVFVNVCNGDKFENININLYETFKNGEDTLIATSNETSFIVKHGKEYLFDIQLDYTPEYYSEDRGFRTGQKTNVSEKIYIDLSYDNYKHYITHNVMFYHYRE